ncbi:MAG TPA: hypothetical protein PL143_11350 [Rhodocyclaceae bacterium]|nr:hypothetical protein [Rhodocyclaceae bacterium]
MKIGFDSRTWHFWISAILAVPILIVSATAVFIAHDKSLGLREIPVAAGWLPGYVLTDGNEAHAIELRTALVAADGSTWLGVKGGLVRAEGGRSEVVETLAGEEVRGLAESPAGLLVATKKGIWLGTGEDWRRVLDGEGWSVGSAGGERLQAVLKDRGLLESTDGGLTWQPAAAMAALAALPEPPTEELTLGKLVMDLHTGKAFLGKRAMWVWIDAIGLVMTFLSATGIYLWWRGLRRKQQLPAHG